VSYHGFGAVEDEWVSNTQQWGQPVWRLGYWFWDQAGVLSRLACVPFGERSNACVAWAAKDLLPPATTPPFLKDMSVASGLSQSDIDRARQWIVNPQLRNAGKTVLATTGALDGKLYWGALLVRDQHTGMPYDQAKIIAQIIAVSEANSIEALDPSAADLIQIPSLLDLKTAINPETTGEPLPFWKSPIILMGGVGLLLVVMVKKRRMKRSRK
jgi:hypothetical protein